MLELSHNGVVIIDAVVGWYQKQKTKQPFEAWWTAMSETERRAITFKVLDQHLRGSLPSKKKGKRK